MTWWQNPYYAWDTETTGVDVENDRIVTATLVCTDRTQPDLEWLLDPIVEIPEQATAVHGVSTERARADGMDAATGINQITEALAMRLATGVPVVIANAPYDLTILDRECRRHHLATLTERLGQDPAPIIDPMCIDKQLDKWRKGKRTLTDLCATYQVKLEGAHSSSGDALAAARVAWRLAQVYANVVGDATLDELHALQQSWRAAWASDFQDYLRKQGKTDVVDGAWPIRQVAA